MSFLSLNGTLVIQLINFAIFFAVLNVVFLRPVAAAIRRRREYINSLASDYERYQAEARQLREEAEDVRAAARRAAEHHLSAARAQASNEAAEIASRFSQQAQSRVEQAHQTVHAELETARSGESQIVRQIADLMLERTVSEATG